MSFADMIEYHEVWDVSHWLYLFQEFLYVSLVLALNLQLNNMIC